MVADTKTRILDTAQRLVQTYGYEGFSFHAIKDEVGLTTASIHYHFATKAHLGVALVRRYRDQLRATLAKLHSAQTPFPKQFESVAALFEGVRSQARICLGSALGGEFGALPSELQTELRALIEDVVNGLQRLLETAQQKGEIRPDLPAAHLARTWFALLQGALTAARATEASFLQQASATLLALLQKI